MSASDFSLGRKQLRGSGKGLVETAALNYKDFVP